MASLSLGGGAGGHRRTQDAGSFSCTGQSGVYGELCETYCNDATTCNGHGHCRATPLTTSAGLIIQAGECWCTG
eukprot:COSAG01_NODE_56834_length_316_cov_0.626728_1_plen_73_part_10